MRNALLMVRYDVVSAYYATDDRDIQSCFKLLFVYAPVIAILCSMYDFAFEIHFN